MMEKFIPDEARIQSVQDNYKKVLSDVKETAIKAGRNPDDVRLMAVTKTVPFSKYLQINSAVLPQASHR